MGREVYPGLNGAEARGRMAQELAADEALAEAVDAAALERGLAPERLGRLAAAAKAESRRVRDLIERDRSLRIADAMREAANIEVAEGVMVNLADTVVEPTPEWLQQNEGQVANYIPRQRDGTVRVLRTKRRLPCPQARKMMLGGVIDFEGYSACCWYAELVEKAGLAGSVPSTAYGKEVFSAPHGRSAFADHQLDWQDTLRRVRALIEPSHLRLLDRMVLNDQPLHRAVRLARAFHRRPKRGFAKAVEQLIDAREAQR